jgi:LacI family transcriptional regulator
MYRAVAVPPAGRLYKCERPAANRGLPAERRNFRSMSEDKTNSVRGKRRQATIIDVADAAGVAVGTVSRYLNGHPIRRGNRDQVERAIAALGYRRNSVAASMKTDTTHMVGLMVPALGEFHAKLLEQLSRKMHRTGRAVLSFCHDLETRSIYEGLEFFATHRVDALIMDGNDFVRDALMRHIDDGLVVVLYDNDMADMPADRVFVDNRKASARAVSHLLDLGHRRVAVIHGNQRDSAGRQRLEGYRDALQSHNVPEMAELVVSGNWSEAGGYGAIRELMGLADPPTAVFSANYNMTIGMLTWLRENGLRLPQDLSLVSFDDVPAFSIHQPGITCIGQPIEKLAETITTLLAARLADPAAMGRRSVVIDCDIILRGSSRRLLTPEAIGKPAD